MRIIEFGNSLLIERYNSRLAEKRVEPVEKTRKAENRTFRLPKFLFRKKKKGLDIVV